MEAKQNIRQLRSAFRATKDVYKAVKGNGGRILFKELYKKLNYTPSMLTELTRELERTGLVETDYDAAGSIVLKTRDYRKMFLENNQ